MTPQWSAGLGLSGQVGCTILVRNLCGFWAQGVDPGLAASKPHLIRGENNKGTARAVGLGIEGMPVCKKSHRRGALFPNSIRGREHREKNNKCG